VDKVIIITGGGTGMGRAYALGVAAEGARVVVADIADPQATVKEIEAGGQQALGILCDVSREEDTLRLAAQAVTRFGRIDVLVNNAAIYGTLRRQPFTEIPIEEWDRVMAVNLRGLFLCARAVFPAMKAQGKGKIINISSGTFFKGVPNYIHYTTSKGGVVGFTRSLARELAPFHVNVNAVCPGAIRTRAHDRLPREVIDKVRTSVPMGYVAEPEDVAGVVAFLASDDARYITGQSILIDGGRWMI
jgi:3-oxoacyl-[acyl-carrier protein] reductase